ncbi:outer membrane lipoprotein carrier protein LolA [Roseobacter denitrificans]|uniref:LolA family protein n=1 Tax=Roseobacter denitrificans TaxID=2434 RepID=UPI000306C38A|nr:outer membrane lipoprotein carrier protein LolA [Roseobacter denitrificans]AVL53004.1 outer membrane lipoprotein carrier protein LolA [Roseobacter denitrificans]SFG27415.1 Outer membrane lipoprotein-sorting protein [Roseobacter denitrificans OCh 114]
MSFLPRALLAACLTLIPVASAAAEQLKLAEISAYLNSLETLKGTFRQINDDGSVSTGQLYIRRPGRMRFEYDPPEQALVIAAASAVVIIDRKSNQPSETYPLSRTPLSLLLGRDIDLTRAAMVRNARFDGTATIVTAEDPDNLENGFLEMYFTDQPTRLEQWVIHDASGAQTRVILDAFETGMELPNSLFDADREKGRDR